MTEAVVGHVHRHEFLERRKRGKEESPSSSTLLQPHQPHPRSAGIAASAANPSRPRLGHSSPNNSIVCERTPMLQPALPATLPWAIQNAQPGHRGDVSMASSLRAFLQSQKTQVGKISERLEAVGCESRDVPES